MGRPIKHKEGDIINGTKVKGFIEKRGHASYYEFYCQYCGKPFVTQLRSIQSGKTKSCGCYKKELNSAASTIHGHSPVGNKSSEYTSWQNMMARCYNPNKTYHFSLYGEKGVVVCQRWQDFKNFIADMGNKPTIKHSIDRFPDKKGNYSCGKCDECIKNGWAFNGRWATQRQQLLNRSNTIEVIYNGVLKPVYEWHDELKLSVPARIVAQRIKKGWPVMEAFFTPVNSRKKKKQFISNFIPHTFGHFN